jgi:hypothetical protein
LKALRKSAGRVNETQLAAFLDLTPQAIRAAVADGRLDPPAEDGTWNRAAAVKQFRANTCRPGMKPGPPLGTHQRASSSILAVPTDGRGVTDDVTPAAVARAEAELRRVIATRGEGLPLDRPIGIGTSRRIQEMLKAERLSLEIQRLRGESISTRSALLTVEVFHRELRDDLLRIPAHESSRSTSRW